MTQQEFNTRILEKARPKGWFLTFLLTKVLPFLWNNREELADLFRKDKPHPVKFANGGGDPITDPDPGTTPDPPQ